MDFSRLKVGDGLFRYNESETFPDYIVAIEKIRGYGKFFTFNCYADDGIYYAGSSGFEPWAWKKYGYNEYEKIKPDNKTAMMVFRFLFEGKK